VSGKLHVKKVTKPAAGSWLAYFLSLDCQQSNHILFFKFMQHSNCALIPALLPDQRRRGSGKREGDSWKDRWDLCPQTLEGKGEGARRGRDGERGRRGGGVIRGEGRHLGRPYLLFLKLGNPSTFKYFTNVYSVSIHAFLITKTHIYWRHRRL
jgi:hypothetical protein